MNDNEKIKIVIDCTLCGDKELHIIQDGHNSMQCLSCGYSTNDNYGGTATYTSIRTGIAFLDMIGDCTMGRCKPAGRKIAQFSQLYR